MQSMLFEAFIYLVAAVVSVPLAKRLGFSSVLGYLFAGILIGPYVLHWVGGDQVDVMHFAEFGVVMMLFLIGLELRIGRLWEMRRSILGLGGLQVVISLILIALIISQLGLLHWTGAIAVGMALALSSTAIVLQSLNEKGLLKTPVGNNVFSVLLFQDIAVIPILALLPLLALDGAVTTNPESQTLIASLPIWAQVLSISVAIAAIVVGGTYLARPIFRYIAETHQREIFTAFALLIVIATTLLMQSLGLSPALGSFLAGMVLAENEFRHEIEINIEPFKGLLLGLFFITVGTSINFQLLLSEPVLIIGFVLALILLKGIVLFSLAKLFRMATHPSLLFTMALAQGGEFAFVISTSALQFNVLDEMTASVLSLVVALSMLVSPVLLFLYDRVQQKSARQSAMEDETIENESPDVILAGYGRFGQIIGRLLMAQGYKVTILDHSPSQIELVRGFGHRVYYGDASREDLLEAAGARDAKLLIVAVDQHDLSLDVIHTARRHFPHLKLAVRAIDRRHTYELMKLEVNSLRRETFHSALELGIDSMQLLGLSEERARRAGNLFAEFDQDNLDRLAKLWGDDQSYGLATRQSLEDLKQVLQADQEKSI